MMPQHISTMTSPRHQQPLHNSQELIPNIVAMVKKENDEKTMSTCHEAGLVVGPSVFPALAMPSTTTTRPTNNQTNSPAVASSGSDPIADALSKADLEDYIAYAKNRIGLSTDIIKGALNHRFSESLEKITAAAAVAASLVTAATGQTSTSTSVSAVSQHNASPITTSQSRTSEGQNPVQGPYPVAVVANSSTQDPDPDVAEDEDDKVSVKCGVCDRLYSSAKHLKRHLRTHTEFRPYKCSLCSRSFFDLNKLKRHSLTHSGLKPYECHICDQKVSRPEHLRRHLLTHSELRPYKCAICDFSARRNDSVRSHIRSKHPGQSVTVINTTAYLNIEDIEKLALEKGGLNRPTGGYPKSDSEPNSDNSPQQKKKKKKRKVTQDGEGVTKNASGDPSTPNNNTNTNNNNPPFTGIMNSGMMSGGQVTPNVNIGSFISGQSQKMASPDGHNVHVSAPSLTQELIIIKDEQPKKIKMESMSASPHCMGSPPPIATSVAMPVVSPGGNLPGDLQLGAWSPETAVRIGGSTLGQAYWDPNMTASVQLASRAQPRQPFFLPPDGNMGLPIPQCSPPQLPMPFNPQSLNVSSSNGIAIKQEVSLGMNTCGQEQLFNQQMAAGLSSFATSFGSSSMPTQVTLSPYFMNAMPSHAQSRMFLNGVANRGKGNIKRN